MDGRADGGCGSLAAVSANGRTGSAGGRRWRDGAGAGRAGAAGAGSGHHHGGRQVDGRERAHALRVGLGDEPVVVAGLGDLGGRPGPGEPGHVGTARRGLGERRQERPEPGAVGGRVEAAAQRALDEGEEVRRQPGAGRALRREPVERRRPEAGVADTAGALRPHRRRWRRRVDPQLVGPLHGGVGDAADDERHVDRPVVHGPVRLGEQALGRRPAVRRLHPEPGGEPEPIGQERSGVVVGEDRQGGGEHGADPVGPHARLGEGGPGRLLQQLDGVDDPVVVVVGDLGDSGDHRAGGGGARRHRGPPRAAPAVPRSLAATRPPPGTAAPGRRPPVGHGGVRMWRTGA